MDVKGIIVAVPIDTRHQHICMTCLIPFMIQVLFPNLDDSHVVVNTSLGKVSETCESSDAM
jgi:hypothetical protein